MSLDPLTISQVYTLAEINAQITILIDVYNNGMKNLAYQLNDMHSRQRVEQHPLKQIADELNSWLKAKAIITGSSQTQLISLVWCGDQS